LRGAICESEDVEILKGVVSKDHIHVNYRPSLSVSDLVQKLKGRTCRKLQDEFPELKKRYWGSTFGQFLVVGVREILLMKW